MLSIFRFRVNAKLGLLQSAKYPVPSVFVSGLSALLLTLSLLIISQAALAKPENGWLSPEIFSQLVIHPEAQSALSAYKASRAESISLSQRLYFPEVFSEIEREGDSQNYRVGIMQSFDIWGKQDGLKNQSQQLDYLAETELKHQLNQTASSYLQALADWELAKETETLMRAVEGQLKQQAATVNQQLKAGEISYLEAGLLNTAQLNLSNEVTQANIARQQAQNKIAYWGQVNTSELAGLLDEMLRYTPIQLDKSQVYKLPDVQVAQSKWQLQQSLATQARLETKSDPNFGISGGRTGDQGVVALTFSMPLQFGTAVSSKINSANALASSAEAGYQAVIFKKENTLGTLYETATAHSNQYRATTSGQANSAELRNLLAKQWRLGDISLADYLRSLDILIDAERLKLKTKGNLLQSNIAWLGATAQLLSPATQAQAQSQIQIQGSL